MYHLYLRELYVPFVPTWTLCTICTYVKDVTMDMVESFSRLRVVAKNRLLPSSCPSVRTYKCRSNWTDYREIRYCGLIRKSAEKLQIWLKSSTNIGNLTRSSTYVSLLQAKLNRYESIFVQRLIFLYCWQWHGARQHTENALLPFHYNNGYANAQQRYFIHTLPTLTLLIADPCRTQHTLRVAMTHAQYAQINAFCRDV
jgi:hypothetical protein